MDASRDETRSLVGPTLIGTGLQLVMVLAGHYSPGVAQFFAPGGMGISALAGALAALGSRPASLGRSRRQGPLRAGRATRVSRSRGPGAVDPTCAAG